VLVLGPPAARPLYDTLGRSLARRGAYAVFQLSLDGGIASIGRSWLHNAPADLVEAPSSLQAHVLRECDALLVVVAPENTRDASAVDAARLASGRAAYRPAMKRFDADEAPWVSCHFPTPAVAQEAGMATDEFADFLFGACLLDWDAERRRIQRYADRFDAAEEVRIVGEGTDLRLGIAGRPMEVDAGGTGGGVNMPGGEFFCCPVEDSAEGEIAFGEFPAIYRGREVRGIHLRFEAGRVVEASAEANEKLLLETLDTDEGARRLGELGIGCNPGITRSMGNPYFDEKIDGTVHLALGFGFPQFGGQNESSVHWDIVKDLRPRPVPSNRASPDGTGGQIGGGRLELDGEVVQENGRWFV
jgi:aminopeptidase